MKLVRSYDQQILYLEFGYLKLSFADIRMLKPLGAQPIRWLVMNKTGQCHAKKVTELM